MQVIINIVISSAIFLLVALSFKLVYQVSKIFSIAHAISLTASAYSFYFFFTVQSYSIFISIIFSILITLCLGTAIALIVYKPLKIKNGNQLSCLIVSLGVYIVLQNIISLLFGSGAKHIRISEIVVGKEILSSYISILQINIIVTCILLYIATNSFLKYHILGKKIKAVSENASLCYTLGINSNQIIIWSFAIGSGLGAVAGILIGLDTGLKPTMGFNFLLFGVVALIIGGVGSTRGLIGGSLLLATSQHLGAYYIDSKWMDAIAYIILILFLLWKPLGFSGKQLKKVEI